MVADLEAYMREQCARLSRGHDLAKAMNYMFKRWGSFTRFLDDGRVCLSNNAAESDVGALDLANGVLVGPLVRNVLDEGEIGAGELCEELTGMCNETT